MFFFIKRKINNFKKRIFYYLVKYLFRKISYLELKKLFINNHSIKNSNIIIEGFWENAHQWLRLIMLINALKSKHKINIIGIYSNNLAPYFQKESINLFSLDKLLDIDFEIEKKYLLKSKNFLSSLKSTKEFLKLKIDYNFPIFYLYDDILRQESIGTFDDIINANISFKEIIKKYNLELYLAKTLSLLNFYNNIFSSKSIDKTIISHQVNSKFACLAWISLINNTDVYVLNYYNKHLTIRKLLSTLNMTEYFDDAPTIQEINNLSEEKKQKAILSGKKYLSLIREGKESEVQIAKPYGSGKKFFKTKLDFLNNHKLSKNKINVVIMGNVWPDYPNGYSNGLFFDYVDWYLFTLRHVVKINNCNWILKSHPGESLYGNKTTLKQLTNITLPKNVVFWNNRANGNDLNEYCDVIVTARGTSAIEYASLGKKVITSFDSPFTRLGFTTHANTKDEYVNLLNNINKIKTLSKNEIDIANIFAASFLADLKDKRFLEFPFGTGGNLLYLKFPSFLKKYKITIFEETEIIKKWLSSKTTRYNTYKFLNDL